MTNQEYWKEIEKEYLKEILEEEYDLVRDSAYKHGKMIYATLRGASVLRKLLTFITEKGVDIDPDNEETPLCNSLKQVKRSTSIGPLHALRGNIGACYFEMRKAIESATTIPLVLPEAANKRLEESENCKRANERLKEIKKKIINRFYMHHEKASIPNTDTKLTEKGINIDLTIFDSESFGKKHLIGTIFTFFETMRQISNFLCSAMKKKGEDVDDFEKEMEEITPHVHKYLSQIKETPYYPIFIREEFGISF